MHKNKPLIHLIAGARPNFMKIAPLLRELKKHPDSFSYQLIHTGQHYDSSMSDVFFAELEIPKPDFHLSVGSGSHAEQTAKIMMAYEPICQNESPDLVMVVGDVNSTLACAIVAKKLNIKVAHIEAGLRSGDRTMPEEINRIVTDSIADLYFVTEKSGVDNLIAEGKLEKNIFFVGHVMIDNLFHQVEKLESTDKESLKISTELKKQYPKYGVVTLHRPANVDDKNILSGIIEALNKISLKLPLIFPIHPRTRQNLETFEIILSETIITTKALPYKEFLNLFKDAKVVLTDSGGIQEETTALGVPCLTLRENTERPVTVTHGTNVLVGTSKNRITEEFEGLAADGKKHNSKPELWDGNASERICTSLKEHAHCQLATIN
jgi:UDP-N-acetylglucosamine 2-epimerase (non-hydrolysing)